VKKINFENKKIIITSCMLFIAFAFSLVIFNSYYDKNVSKLDSSSKLPDGISVFVDNGDGYKKSSNIPVGNYVLDEEKTYCEGGGKVSNYDSAVGTIKYTVSGQDECGIYFKLRNLSLSSTVIGLVSDNEYTSSQPYYGYRMDLNEEGEGSGEWIIDYDNIFQSTYVVKHEEVTHNGTTYDAGVRYEGIDPDNYVQFNGNEEWRIIGVFEGSTIGLEPGKQYTKIRSSVPVYSHWSCEEWVYGEGYCLSGRDVTNWADSVVHDELNGSYFNRLSDNNKIAQYNGNYSTWHLAQINEDDSAYYTAQDWFLQERVTGYDASASVAAAVGLIYPSDYRYAAYGTVEYECPSDNSCPLNTWLAPNPQVYNVDSLYTGWTISVFDDGGIIYFFNSEVALWDSGEYPSNVYPTLYLEYDVEITGGTGTKLDPYILN